MRIKKIMIALTMLSTVAMMFTSCGSNEDDNDRGGSALKPGTLDDQPITQEGIAWKNDASSLIVYGRGDMDDYERGYSPIPHITDNLTAVKSIVIKEGITSIGNYAFYGFDKVTSISIPNGITHIGEQGFGFCESVTSITIPDTVTTMGMGAFKGCYSLEEIVIPGSVTNLDTATFLACRSLEKVVISEGVTTIGNQVFEDCTSLTSVSIPSTVTSIGKKVFSVDNQCTFYVVKGSYAESYVKENGYRYKLK